MFVISLETTPKHKALIVTDMAPAKPETFTLPVPLSSKHREFVTFVAKHHVSKGSSFDFPEEDGFTKEEADELLDLFAGESTLR